MSFDDEVFDGEFAPREKSDVVRAAGRADRGTAVDVAFEAARPAARRRRDRLPFDLRAFRDRPLPDDVEVGLDAFRDDVRKLSDPEADREDLLRAAFFGGRENGLQDSFGDASYRSIQEKQGSIEAMIRPASATELFRSMTGTVGAFLNVGTWIETRLFVSPPSVTTL